MGLIMYFYWDYESAETAGMALGYKAGLYALQLTHIPCGFKSP
jgi:hypothetical protein